ncbi:MAG: hypothetical protein QXE86_05120 [Archaeoglobaceae archaeon]
MLRISKFMKFEAEVVVARDVIFENDSLILVHPNLAKIYGLRDGNVLEISREDKIVNLRVKISEKAPENGCLIPNNIFASYLCDTQNFKRFKAFLELSDSKATELEEIIRRLRE